MSANTTYVSEYNVPERAPAALQVYEDYQARRKGILSALGPQFESFWTQCDPSKDNLCLYGHASGSWSVDLPAEEVPPELPEPALGINFARDGMSKRDWLALVAVHSDTWLLAVAFYNGARLNREGRDQLFELINEQPTCYETVVGKNTATGPPKPKRSSSMYSDPPKPAPPRPSKPAYRREVHSEDEDLDSDEDEEGDNETYADGEGDPCPNCGRIYKVSDFWIQCDFCNTWYDGKCVGMTQAKADKMSHQQWKCPGCEQGIAKW